MNYKILFDTVRHLRLTQVWYQIKYRLIKSAYKTIAAPPIRSIQGMKICKVEPITRYKCLEGNRFSFLNLEHEFAGWNFSGNGMLWAYNQNYFDWLNQSGLTEVVGCRWIDRFIDELPSNKIGLDPYPIALRSLNWVKFFCRYPNSATKNRLDSLYSQLRLLEKKLEFHLLANHLLEDLYALYVGATYFGDIHLLRKATMLLLSQFREQILPDGSHYEQSPMYHCILLDRLLDCINIGEQTSDSYSILRNYAERMLGHLESMIWSDGSIPLSNDAAYGIAPTSAQLFDYARRLDIQWKAIPMKECGYKRMQSERMEAFVDVGNITATYQPGHTHADTLNYELRVDGKPFVVDTGISTYNKNERRMLERGTVAHNCVSVDGRNSSEVWGGFRVGKRCRTEILEDASNMVTASHDGFGKECKRRFEMTGVCFFVEDWFDGEAVSYVHLADGVDPNRVQVDGASAVNIKSWKYSTEYNRFHDGMVIEIKFVGHVKYTIQ